MTVGMVLLRIYFQLMEYLRPIPTLEDSRRFLHDARGLPHTIDGKKRAETYLKASVVFCWLAVEEQVKLEIAKYAKIKQAPPAPTKLHDRMVFCFAALYARKIVLKYLQEKTGRNLFDDDYGRRLIEEKAFGPRVFEHSTAHAKECIPFDEFWNHRSLRNDVVHINTPLVSIAPEQAKSSILYCVKAIEMITGCPFIHLEDNW